MNTKQIKAKVDKIGVEEKIEDDGLHYTKFDEGVSRYQNYTKQKEQELQEWKENEAKYIKLISDCKQKFIENFSEIKSFFTKKGFLIQEIEYLTVTGGDDYGPYESSQDNTLINDRYLNIDLRLKMTGRLRPSEDDKRNRRIADSVRNDFKQLFDSKGFSMAINQFSLDRSEGIMCDIWIKPEGVKW